MACALVLVPTLTGSVYGDQDPPLWIGNEFSHDMRSKGDPIPRLEIDPDRTVTFGPGPATAEEVYKALGDAAGIQFIFDRRIDLGKRATPIAETMPVREALDVISEQLDHFSVVWGSRTIYIAPDIDWKRMVEEHVAIQFFYLSHAEPRAVITTLRSLIQSRQIAEVPRLNAVVLRDTVANLETAEELVEGMDLPDAKAARAPSQ